MCGYPPTRQTATVNTIVTINEDAGDIKVWTQGQTYNVECSGEAKIGAVLAKLNVMVGDEAKQIALMSGWGTWYCFKSEALTYKGETLDVTSNFAAIKFCMPLFLTFSFERTIHTRYLSHTSLDFLSILI